MGLQDKIFDVSSAIEEKCSAQDLKDFEDIIHYLGEIERDNWTLNKIVYGLLDLKDNLVRFFDENNPRQ